MNSKIKKSIATFLGSSFFGGIFLALGRGSVKKQGITYSFGGKSTFRRTAARIVFGFYESAERRMIGKYLPADLDVVELGGSVGYISTLIQRKLDSSCKHIILEPDEELAIIAEKNIMQNFQDTTSIVVNLPYGTPGRNFCFTKGKSHIAGKLVESTKTNEESESKLLSVETLLNDYEIDDYTLVMDVEGAEAMLVYDEPKSLKKCQHIIAELHSTILDDKKISVKELISSIQGLGFQLVNSDGNVFVFKR